MFTNEKKNEKKRSSGCYNCGGKLEVIEANLKKETKIMKCQDCGLFHLYNKGLMGNWKLLKVTKDPSHSFDAEW